VSVEAPGSATALEIPAVVLTSSYTVSAAEIGLLALKELPNVTIIGENTAGALSDMMERQLPNGWEFSLPHQVYEAVDGTHFEGPGIPPDIAIPMNIEAFDQGRDRILEAATTYLNSKP
jgi:C-terminal processing protease CtpA/Prc